MQDEEERPLVIREAVVVDYPLRRVARKLTPELQVLPSITVICGIRDRRHVGDADLWVLRVFPVHDTCTRCRCRKDTALRLPRHFEKLATRLSSAGKVSRWVMARFDTGGGKV